LAEQERTVPARPITRADGTTTAERYLKRLCDHSFLSLWSYPGVYRDQGRTGESGEGKEVCDLLVVFEDHILIFSDKDCAFPDRGDLDLDWSRWYRRAVENSAKQVWGAERWIKSHPNRLFLDRACTQPFPLDLPNLATAKFHRIVVAHDVSERCRRELAGTGSLMIAPRLVGADHSVRRDEGGVPFTIGQIDPTRGFVHVLDDTSLEVVMSTLDTITDFVSYLSKKERFILDGYLGWAAGEDDLLAYYLRHLNADGVHDFVVPPGHNAIFIGEGLWPEFARHPQRLAQVTADEISYSWDALIESFSRHILAKTQHFTSHPDVWDQEKGLRFLAREPRTRRRMLAELLHELIFKTPQQALRAARVVLPSAPGDPHYVFLLLSEPQDKPYEEYREVRRSLLQAYCMVVKLQYPGAEDIVGIATETGTEEVRTEDTLYYDARGWTEQEQAEAQRLATDHGLLRDVQHFAGVVQEYPASSTTQVPRGFGRSDTRLKGRHRNARCPCGSGTKYKNCCGR
jgi:hypothetical protein